jgi:putative membrane protein
MQEGRQVTMSKRTAKKAAAGVLAMALAAAPMSALHSQTPARQDSASHPTWRVNGGTTTMSPPARGNPATTTTSPTARLDVRADTAFVRDVVVGNRLEVQLGNLAERKASNPAVKQFAQQMVKDHTTMENQWTALGVRNGVPVPALDPAGKQAISQADRLSGPAFDQAYMTSMVADHQQTVSLLQQRGQQAQSAEVRQLAANCLLTVQQHLTMAQQVGSQVGATPGVAVVPQNPAAATNGQVTNQNDKSFKDLDSDKELIREVTEDHMWELRLNQMAQRKATNKEVKQFAQNMVNDFTRWQNRWEDLVVKSRMASRPGINHDRDKKEDQLQRASRKEFDRLFAATVADHLQSFVPSLQQRGRSAHSSQVRKLVDDELPTLRQRLAEAKRLHDTRDLSKK